MKLKILPLITAATLLIGCSVAANAQIITNQVPNQLTNSISSLPNFLDQVYSWSTSVNTNYSWTNVTAKIETGYKQQVGKGAGSVVRVEYDINHFDLGIEGQFYGVGSAFNEVEGVFGYAFFVNHDFQLEGNILAGWDGDTSAYVVEPELKALKMLTVNTFISASYAFPFESKGKFNTGGQARVGVGFLF